MLQARSQTLKKGGEKNYFEQGLIQSFLEGNSMQNISNIRGSGVLPQENFWHLGPLRLLLVEQVSQN